nr:hypothetical protein [Tanacetum cinerariifolium]
MGDEHLNTILATKLDEFIKSSVENVVPNPSESEGGNGCDMPACCTTFSNILFDADYEFDSSDNQSLYDEVVPDKIFSNPLFKEKIISMKTDQHHDNAESDLVESLHIHDSSLINSSKIDSLLDELLYDNSSLRPPEEFVSENSDAKIESFSLSPIPVKDSDSLMEEIDLSFNADDPMPLGIEEDDYDSERDILIREELLDNYSVSLPVIQSYHFDIPSFSCPPTKPPDDEMALVLTTLFLLCKLGCDLLALVSKFTLVEESTCLLETTLMEDVVLMGVFPDEGICSVNLIFLLLFTRVTAISLVLKLLMQGHVCLRMISNS